MLPKYYEFHNPVKILSGFNALENIPYEITFLGGKRPMIVTDKGISSAGLVKTVIDACGDSGIVFSGIFDDVPSDSSTDTVNAAAKQFKETGADSLIAIGGGSVLDTAKGINIVVTEGGVNLKDFAGADRLVRKMKPYIAVPTTSGTGSEVTVAAVIADTGKHRKMLFTSSRLLPDVAVLDPRMTMTLPPYITAATGMDALTHAIEAYTCLQKNPISDAYATTAISLMRGYLLQTIEKSTPENRLALANASCMAGAAFSNSMVGMIHSLGHALGGVCRVPHGVAMNIFLPHALEYNMRKIPGLIGELLLYVSGSEVFSSTPDEDRPEMTIKGIRELQMKLKNKCGLPMTLKEASVSRDSFSLIAEAAINDGSIVHNPEEMDYNDAMNVLEKAYE
ncbi:MAG TPA: iron-containing alcohol dehydrogenase [Spirochaetota bacterium]|nr:iron-containing alcohol dehydrogenase [Spirochaetota bacterium]